MFTPTNEPLTAEKARLLSAGAVKFWVIVQSEKNAPSARYQALTGYCERSVRKFTNELEKSGLLTRSQEMPLSAEQQDIYQELIDLGVNKPTARRLVMEQSLGAIQMSLEYVQSRPEIRNQAGYLIRRLQEQAKAGWSAPQWLTKRQDSFESAPVADVLVTKYSDQAALVDTNQLSLPLSNAVRSTEPRGEQQGFALLAYSVSVACGCDLQLNPEAREAVHRLYSAGYTAEDIAYFLKAYWPTIWPGTKGEPPTLKSLLEHIGHARHLMDMADGGSSGDELLRRIELLQAHLSGEQPLQQLEDLLPIYKGHPLFNPYLNHPRFKSAAEQAEREERERERGEEAEWLRLNCPMCERPHSICKCISSKEIPSRVRDSWLATLGQLQIQLNRATYDTWLRHIELVRYADNVLTIEVPHLYAQDWINKHLLASMTRTFDEIFGTLGNPNREPHLEQSILVEVVPEPDFGEEVPE